MKFSERGHSIIQEVDAVHSNTERGLKHLDLFSPLGLVRKLLKVRKTRPLNALQMTQSKFFDLQKPAKLCKFSLVPYSKLKPLEFHQDNAKRVWFKTSSLEACKWLLFHKNVLRLKSVPTLRLSVLLSVLFCPDFVAKILIYCYENQRCQVSPEVHPQPRTEAFWNQDWTVQQGQGGYWTFGSLSVCARSMSRGGFHRSKTAARKETQQKMNISDIFVNVILFQIVLLHQNSFVVPSWWKEGSPRHFVVTKFTKISVRSDYRICISFQFLTMKTSPFSSNIRETLLVIFSIFFWSICEKNRLYRVSSSKGEIFKSRFSRNFKNLSYDKTTLRGRIGQGFTAVVGICF